MKIEGQSPTAQVDFLKQSMVDSESLVLMRLLRKCAEEINNETLSISLQADAQKSPHAEGALEVLAPSKASKSKSSDQIFLEAFMAALQIDDALKVLSQSAIRTLLVRANQDTKRLDTLTQEINKLQESLSNALDVKELRELLSKIDELINLYNSAIIQYAASEKVYLENHILVEALSEKITSLQHQYDGIVDKASDEAKEAKNELEATILLRIAAEKEMVSAQKLMQKAQASIKDAIGQLSALASQYPKFEKTMNEMKNLMESKESIEEKGGALSAEITSVEASILEIENQITEKKADQQAIITSLNEGAGVLKGILSEASKADLSHLNEQEAAVLLDGIVDRYLSQVEKKDEKESQESVRESLQFNHTIEVTKRITNRA